jgi:hypothetical protein
MKKPLFPIALGFGLALTLVAPDASAQRRIIGADSADSADEEGEDEDEDEKKKKKPKTEKEKKAEEAKKKKAEEAKKKKAEEAERKRKAKEAAAEAARKAAEEAERKKEEAEQRKKEEAERKAKKKAEESRRTRLKAAKKTRSYSRKDGSRNASIALVPGKPTKGKVQELRLELAERLEVADPKYGNNKPLIKWNVVATVTEPATKGTPKTYTYRVQPLRAPGTYGMHHTPQIDGEYTISFEATKGDDSASFEMSLHVGVWPPPDFEDEEDNNAAAQAGRAAGSRRIVGSN